MAGLRFEIRHEMPQLSLEQEEKGRRQRKKKKRKERKRGGRIRSTEYGHVDY